jgi:hypothetical protein
MGYLRTTERYLHTLPDADETALDALAKVRNRRCVTPETPSATLLPRIRTVLDRADHLGVSSRADR